MEDELFRFGKTCDSKEPEKIWNTLSRETIDWLYEHSIVALTEGKKKKFNKRFTSYCKQRIDLDDSIINEIVIDNLDSGQKLLVSDINVMYEASKKADNGAVNDKRENILTQIDRISPVFLDDPEYGEKWTGLKQQWEKSVKLLYNGKYKKMEIIHKGGCGQSYDFQINFLDSDNSIVHTAKVEFKSQTGKLEKLENLPQLAQWTEKTHHFFPESFGEFYYDNYLLQRNYDKLLPKTEYLKLVYNFTKAKAERTNLFREIYDDPERENMGRNAISVFIQRHGKDINIKTVMDKIKKTQPDKIYFLWNNGKFKIDSFIIPSTESIKFLRTKNNNSVIIGNDTIEFLLYFCWKNTLGVCNPAWKLNIERL